MPGKHNKPTIAFRPSSSWQYSLINERAKLSGMAKKDFICRSLIYANICVVGKKENIRIIVVKHITMSPRPILVRKRKIITLTLIS